MRYCCEGFKRSCEEGFIELFGDSEYTLQVYEFENEDNRCEFSLSYCPFCGEKIYVEKKEEK